MPLPPGVEPKPGNPTLLQTPVAGQASPESRGPAAGEGNSLAAGPMTLPFKEWRVSKHALELFRRGTVLLRALLESASTVSEDLLTLADEILVVARRVFFGLNELLHRGRPARGRHGVERPQVRGPVKRMDRLEDHLVDLLPDHGQLGHAVGVRADDLLELLAPRLTRRQHCGRRREVGAGLLRLEGEAEGRPVGDDLRELMSHCFSFASLIRFASGL